MTLQELIDSFLVDVCGGKTNQTEAAYRGKLRRLSLFFGPDLDPKDITRGDLDRFKYDLQTRKTKQRGSAKVKGGLSPFTIRTVLITVRFLFSWAASLGYIPMNPMELVRIHTPPAPQPKAITPETVEKLLKVAATHGKNWERARNVAIIYLLRDTGGRAGALAGSLLGDLDLRRGWLLVTEKGSKQTTLFLTQTTIDALTQWVNRRHEVNPTCDRLLLSYKGSGLSYKGLYTLVRELAIKAGIEGDRWNPHAFRHAFARDSLQNGAELSQVAEMMGHSDTRVTSMYYARWSPSELKKVDRKSVV